MRNIYYAFIDVKTNTTEILNHQSGEIQTIKGIDILNVVNISQPTLIFVNLLYYLSHYKYVGGSCVGENYVKKCQKETVAYEYGNVIFRNIACFTNGNSVGVLSDMFPDLPITVAMQHFIMSFNGNPEKVKYTLGYCCKKMFYDNIKKDLWEEKKANKAYYYDLQTYNDMMVANKAGALSYHQSYEENVLCYDKKSAYASVILNDNHFPIGKMSCIQFADRDKLRTLVKKYLKKDIYFKIVLDYKVEGFSVFYEQESKKTGLERENIIDIMEDNRLDEFFENITSGRIYKCSKTGYCSETLRSAVHDAYIKKESATGTEKFFLKTILNINIYGKSIQKYDFETKFDLQNHYRGRGDNYLNPEMGLHCQAVLFHEIHKAQRHNVAIYWDTDGIKVKNTPEARKYFEEQNAIILKRNEESGFPCNIGTWELEAVAKRFVSFGAKRYMVEDETGNVELTWSGMSRSDKQIIMSGLGNDPIRGALKKGILDISRQYVVINDEIKEVFPKDMKVIKFEGDYEWQKRKQNEDISKSNQSSKSIRKQGTISSLADVVRERRILHSKNVSEMQSTEKESLLTSDDTRNLSRKPILTTLLEHTIIGLTDTQVESGIRSCIIGPVSISRGGGRMTMERGKRKQEIHNQLEVHGR